jgi:hypothetical protein
MKADRFTNLRIIEQTTDALRTEYVVSSNTDIWSVTQRDSSWFVTHQGRHYRAVTDTPQGQTILTFVKEQVYA